MIDEIKHLLLNRFSSEIRTEKKVLLQGIAYPLSLSIIWAALQNGWTVAIIRKDADENYLLRVQSELGSHIHITTNQSDNAPIVLISSKHETLDTWLSGEKTKPNQPYAWQEDECAIILFTSGSTGKPKGVCHSLGNIIRSAELFTEHFEIKDNDHLYCLAPPHTMSGFRSSILPLVSAAQVSIPQSSSASFLSIIKDINQFKPTMVICGPVFIKQLAAYGKRLIEHIQSVQALLCTGADLDEEDREAVKRIFGVPVVNYYGLTETAGIVLAETTRQQQRDCLPAPCKGIQISLTPVEGSNQLFQLGITGPNMFLGYLGEPLSRRTSYDSGDLVQRTSDGQLRLMGRSSGAVKAPSTEWIFPILLECWLKSQLHIADAVVKGCKVSGGYGVEIWVDCSKPPLDYPKIDKAIIQRFSSEYSPVQWHEAMIKRNHLGKVDLLIEKNSVSNL